MAGEPGGGGVDPSQRRAPPNDWVELHGADVGFDGQIHDVRAGRGVEREDLTHMKAAVVLVLEGQRHRALTDAHAVATWTIERLVCHGGQVLILEHQGEWPGLPGREIGWHELDGPACQEIVLQLPAHQLAAAIAKDCPEVIALDDDVPRGVIRDDRVGAGPSDRGTLRERRHQTGRPRRVQAGLPRSGLRRGGPRRRGNCARRRRSRSRRVRRQRSLLWRSRRWADKELVDIEHQEREENGEQDTSLHAQRAFTGWCSCGTGSRPPVQSGWQRASRRIASHPPRTAPCRATASSAYDEHDGTNRHNPVNNCDIRSL